MSKSKGQFTVSPFTNPSGTTSWRVVGTKLDGTRVRLSYPAEAVARATKNDLEREALNEGSPQKLLATTLSPQQLRLAELAFEKVPEDEFLAAADYWVEREPIRASDAPPVADAVTAFTDWLDANTSLRELTKANLASRVKLFSASYGGHRLADLSPEHIEQFLAARSDLSAVTKDNIRRSLSRFFSWCIERPRRWLKANPCKEVTIEKDETSAPEILTVPQCEKLLREAEKFKKGRCVRYVALCLFGKLRPYETRRLKESQINLADNEIRLEADQAKTGRARVITIDPTLKAWLQAYPGPVTRPNWRRDFDAVKLAAGFCARRTEQNETAVPWVEDVLRHTGISHYFRKTGSYGLTAEQSGNSEAIIKQHYQSRVSSADTRKFYAILPVKRRGKKDKKIIDLPATPSHPTPPPQQRTAAANEG